MKNNQANETRAKRAFSVTINYVEPGEDIKTALIDLLADVQHLCDQKGLNFDTVLQSSKRHYTAEVENEV